VVEVYSENFEVFIVCCQACKDINCISTELSICFGMAEKVLRRGKEAKYPSLWVKEDKFFPFKSNFIQNFPFAEDLGNLRNIAKGEMKTV
jgi:hypothetical protein